MNPTQKTVLLAILTVLFYATSILITSGKLIFPFPLFEIISLIAAIRISTLEKKDKTIWFGAIPTLLVGALHTQFVWAFILPAEKLEHFFLSLKYDLIYLFYFVGILVWGCMIFIPIRRKQVPFFIVFIALFSILPFLHTYLSELLLYLYLASYSVVQKLQTPSTYLFLLLAVFSVLRISMIYFS